MGMCAPFRAYADYYIISNFFMSSLFRILAELFLCLFYFCSILRQMKMSAAYANDFSPPFPFQTKRFKQRSGGAKFAAAA